MSINKPLIRKRIHNFFFMEIDPFILGFYRIFLGLFFVLYYIMLAPNWLKYYSTNGIATGGNKLLHEYQLFDSVLLYITSNTGLWLFYALSLIFSVCLILGVLWRLPIIWLWMANFSIMYRNLAVANAEEQLMAVLLFFSLFLPLNASLSLSNYIQKRKGPNKIIVWALRPLQIQIALIFALSLPHKLMSDFAWRDGTVTYYATHGQLFARWPSLPFFGWANALLSRILTFFTLAFQGMFPILVWFRPFRAVLPLIMIFLHLGYIVFLEGLAMFNLAMVVALILFLPSHETRIVVARTASYIGKRLKPG